ncbi:cache sensor protein [Nitritalea halalkaliphila LW7]|uniref:Cache sensor protein n=2 Tax=Nitritalea TaxID=1187887 RepID=I5C2Y1_9BACT|nr:cache sensor protein [Nitritalea halalkaliphila LW7]
MVFVSACNPVQKQEEDSAAVRFASSFYTQLIELERAIIGLTLVAEEVVENAPPFSEQELRKKYDLSKHYFNTLPRADTSESSLYVSALAPDKVRSFELLAQTERLDRHFKKVLKENPLVTQVYLNSSYQINRLYPPYEAQSMLTEVLDVTSYNFYYMADELNNPNKGPVWIQEAYVDPVGKGWMVSLLHPVYRGEELLFVLGADLTISSIIENYLRATSELLLIVDQNGVLVAGKDAAVEMFSLPPIRNYSYIQPVIRDSFRPEAYNLYQSKQLEVRLLAETLFKKGAEVDLFSLDDKQFEVIKVPLEKLNWFVLELRPL